MTQTSDRDILATFETLALQAGRAVMDVYQVDFPVELKADASPVTEADAKAEAIILAGLREAYPDIPCVAEEEASAGICPPELDGLFFLVDPLDGTREFIKRNPEFTVNIALIRQGIPVIGVVYAPARSVLYSASPEGAFRIDTVNHKPGERRNIIVRTPTRVPTVVASRSHRTEETDSYIQTCGAVELVSIGSSLKFCLLAEGEADIYPRFGRTMEWDTAAGDAILRAAGGTTRRVDGEPLTYGKRGQAEDCDFSNPWFIADTKPD
ncbi:3'(2'),5'-bisphosphate nucleotidase CysQ [Tianweitania sp.]|uniref:3'(2'),5'-bisphosphate nucleotidase CysQ n=1 Tax=Tianweitania sp. TaxID=2021634 RepID=UPI00289788D3|nr:3'(2'),5'-bisphosphate nucleotidase CysQ [Tianweitania sp.]